MQEKVQEQKALLCKELGDLVMRIPPGVCNGSTQMDRQWKDQSKKAKTALSNKKTSIPKLKEWLSTMSQYK